MYKTYRMIRTRPSVQNLNSVSVKPLGMCTDKVGPEARALGLGRAWLGPGPGLGVFTSPSPPKPGPDPGWARAAGPDGPLRLGGQMNANHSTLISSERLASILKSNESMHECCLSQLSM